MSARVTVVAVLAVELTVPLPAFSNHSHPPTTLRFVDAYLLAHDAPLTSLCGLQMSQSREDSVYLAKLAEQAERYEGSWFLLVHVCGRVAHAFDAYRDGREHEARRVL